MSRFRCAGAVAAGARAPVRAGQPVAARPSAGAAAPRYRTSRTAADLKLRALHTDQLRDAANRFSTHFALHNLTNTLYAISLYTYLRNETWATFSAIRLKHRPLRNCAG